jgi:toxin ParE1/3/4
VSWRAAAKPIVRRALADLDIAEAIDHCLAQSTQAALGFVDALESAFAHIAKAPAIGSPRYAHELNLPGLRFWACTRYPQLVFYVERADAIEVWRVLHASRDIAHWLRDGEPE